MAIKTSQYTGGYGRKNMSSPFYANSEVVEIIEHTFTTGLVAADTLDLFYIPPGCRLTDVRLVAVGTGAATANVGLMSGEPGSLDAARTLGTELFNAVTPTTAQTAAITALLGIAKSDVARSVGVKFSADVAANPATKLHLIVRYTG